MQIRRPYLQYPWRYSIVIWVVFSLITSIWVPFTIRFFPCVFLFPPMGEKICMNAVALWKHASIYYFLFIAMMSKEVSVESAAGKRLIQKHRIWSYLNQLLNRKKVVLDPPFLVNHPFKFNMDHCQFLCWYLASDQGISWEGKGREAFTKWIPRRNF